MMHDEDSVRGRGEDEPGASDMARRKLVAREGARGMFEDIEDEVARLGELTIARIVERADEVVDGAGIEHKSEKPPD
jgi:hypothetical protein